MPRPLALALVGAFVAVDLVLVALVYQHINREPPPSGITVEATATPENDDAEDGTEQQTYEFEPRDAAMVDIANDGTFILATRGSCGRGADGTVETSSNGGAKTSSSDPNLAEILAVRAGSGGVLTVVGADSDCQVQQVTSPDGGSTWNPDLEVTLWHPDVEDVRKVVSPERTSKAGCTVTSVSQVGDDFARVTCVDGKIRGTGNAGKKWVNLGRLDNVRLAYFSTFNKGFALARYQGCAAHAFTTTDSGASWEPGGCIVGDPARAIASSDTTLIAVVGEDAQIYSSTDGGREFLQP